MFLLSNYFSIQNYYDYSTLPFVLDLPVRKMKMNCVVKVIIRAFIYMNIIEYVVPVFQIDIRQYDRHVNSIEMYVKRFKETI